MEDEGRNLGPVGSARPNGRPQAPGAQRRNSAEEAPAEAGAQNQAVFTPCSFSSCCSSPASNISIMMSLPPTNSPLT